MANSLEYPERIQRGNEWTQFLKRLLVPSLSVPCLLACLLACKQIFSFFPLSSFSFYTVQYRRVQYSTVIGQLPRVSTEDRVVSVFETSVCSLFFVQAAADITGQLQIWSMKYILYLGINLAIIIKQYGDRKNSSGF